MNDELLNDAAAAEYLTRRHHLKIAPRTLRNLRVTGRGPVFQRFGKYVAYNRADLDAYAATRISPPMRSTRDPVHASQEIAA